MASPYRSRPFEVLLPHLDGDLGLRWTEADLEAGLAALSDDDDLADTVIRGAELSFRSAHHLRLSAVRIERSRLTGTSLVAAMADDVVFEGCDLSGADLSKLSARRLEFRDCRMSGVILAESVLHHLHMVGCRLDGANFRFATLEHALIKDCDLTEADLQEAKLSGVGVHDCAMTRAQLSHVRIEGLRLHGSDLTGLGGVASLRGATVGSDQVMALAHAVLAELGVSVDDDPEGRAMTDRS